MMETPFPRSISFVKKYNRLLEIVKPSDTLGILINADPDSMASAMALKRIFWKKGGGCENYHTLRRLCA